MAKKKTARGHARKDAAYLKRLGERIRSGRSQRGMTQSALAKASRVSLRFLVQLESGLGNPSIIVLRHIATAMGFSVDRLTGDEPPRPVDQTLLVETLRRLTPEQLVEARQVLREHFGHFKSGQREHVALIGLRGAGKTTLGQLLAQHRNVPFIELDREVELELGASIGQILELHGQSGYLRYERSCLEDALARHPRSVIEVGGGLATDPESLNILLDRTRVVWVHASPEEHMQRVIDQGDMRPMANSPEAMEDLRKILSARVPFYCQAPLHLGTSRMTVEQSFEKLLTLLSEPTLKAMGGAA